MRALRDDGFGAVCEGEPRSHTETAKVLSQVVMPGFGLGVVSVISDWLNVEMWGGIGLLLVGSLAVALVGLRASVGIAAIGVVALWVVLLIAHVARSDGDVLKTVGWPFLLSAVVLWLVRRRRLKTVARVSPLLLPVTLTVLLIPLFTDDLWRTAQELRLRHLVVLSVLTVLPLVYVLTRQLRGQIGPVVRRASEDVLNDAQASASRAKERLVRLVDDSEKESVADAVSSDLAALYSHSLDFHHVDLLERRLTPSLRRKLVFRVLWTACGLALGVTLYLYVLAWTLIPGEVSAEWLGSPVDGASIDLLVAHLTAPLGAYVVVAALLGLIATSVLLGFVITEERYAGDVTGAVLYEPVHGAATVGLPYVAIRARDDSDPPA